METSSSEGHHISSGARCKDVAWQVLVALVLADAVPLALQTAGWVVMGYLGLEPLAALPSEEHGARHSSCEVSSLARNHNFGRQIIFLGFFSVFNSTRHGRPPSH